MEDSHTSIRKAAQYHEISRGSVHNILKANKMKPYRIHLLQQLSEDDFDRRLQFCEDVMQRIDNNNQFCSNILFSDEASFELYGTVNRHNCRYWSDTNPHWSFESKTQYPQKLNIWAGILRNRIVGPFFIDGNLNAAQYIHLLQTNIIPAVQDIAGPDFHEVWFQQDGAPAHFGVRVRELLDRVFPNRWIGRRGELEWPPRSPDLTPLDFFLWGYLKENVYKTPVENLQELRRRIVETCETMPPQNLINSVNSVYHRLAHCQTVNGGHFEHLLN